MMEYKFIVTQGDPNGIGPEMILKYSRANSGIDFLYIGDKSAVDFWSRHFGIPYSFEILDIGTSTIPEPGKLSYAAGVSAYKAIETGYQTAKKLGLPLVTLPVSKKAISLSKPEFTGHTEHLAELDGKKDYEVVMLLGGEKMKVVTLTRHIPLKDVSAAVTQELIERQVMLVNSWFERWKGRKPEIWIAGLNPHAGESGNTGEEEIKTIFPAVFWLKSKGVNISGPIPADTMFYFGLKNNIDILVSCYHDQGLAPLKLLHFEDGVNVTIGLSIVRTSVDHGTGFDIAGKGTASIKSLETAINWAVDINRSFANSSK